MSIYNDNILKLLAQGYMGHPITPADVTYVAAKSPVVFSQEHNRFVNLAGWPTRTEAITEPQPSNAGIGVVCGGGLIAFDCDADESALRFVEAFPESPVAKEGRKGGTYFYYADFPVPSENFFDAGGNKVIIAVSVGKRS